MEKVEVSKEFILKAYNDACTDWKEKIRAEVPDLFTLSGGKWKVNPTHHDCFVYLPDNPNKKETYAIHCDNHYSGAAAISVVKTYSCGNISRDRYRDLEEEDFIKLLGILAKNPGRVFFNKDE